MTIEYRCACNRCGSSWCLNDADFKENKRLKMGRSLNMVNAALQATDNTVASVYGTFNAESYGSRITDYARCPRCGSININVSRHEF